MERNMTWNKADAMIYEAICESVQYDRIVRLPYNELLATALLSEAEDSADNNLEVEYWGQDEDGRFWTIHLERMGTKYKRDIA